MADKLVTVPEVLSLLPHQPPFRFIDDILEVDDEHIRSSYRFREDEDFYRGHFPGYPVTPGVILVETMAQAGVAAFGIYLMLRQGRSPDEIGRTLTLFATADAVEFNEMVLPGETIFVRGTKRYMRRGSLKVSARMEKENGRLVCSGILSGKGVSIHE